MTEKTINFGEVLTKRQQGLAEAAWRKRIAEREGDFDQRPSEPYAKWAQRVIFNPKTMLRIDAATGQENDPGYMAYALEYVMWQWQQEARWKHG